VVSRLDQFPAFLPLGVKDILQPPGAALAGIVDKTVSRMVTFDHLILFASWRKLVKRNPIVPFRHILPLSSEIVKFVMGYIKNYRIRLPAGIKRKKSHVT